MSTDAFVCPLCGSRSFNPNDIRESYCARCHVSVKRADNYTFGEVGQIVDLGWGVGLLREDMTFWRMCKGCGVSSVSPVSADGAVEPKPMHHTDWCPVFQSMSTANRCTRCGKLTGFVHDLCDDCRKERVM